MLACSCAGVHAADLPALLHVPHTTPPRAPADSELASVVVYRLNTTDQYEAACIKNVAIFIGGTEVRRQPAAAPPPRSRAWGPWLSTPAALRRRSWPRATSTPK